jgi:polyhydroxyalkanoate synthesis regulator phasin
MGEIEKLKFMAELIQPVIDYLEEEKSICEDALRAYEPQAIQDSDSEIRIMREREAIKLRDRVSELKRHIAVIKRMIPKHVKG